jgi:hypothetical protein
MQVRRQSPALALAFLAVFACAPHSVTSSDPQAGQNNGGDAGTIVIDARDARGQFLGVPAVIRIIGAEQHVNLGVTVESISTATFSDLPRGDYVIQVTVRNREPAETRLALAGQTVTVSVEMTEGSPGQIALRTDGAHASEPRPLEMTSLAPAAANQKSCAVDEVIQNASKRLEEFVENVNRISAIEVLEHERLDKHGKVTEQEKRRFNYVAIIEEISPGAFDVAEYRDGAFGAAGGFPHDISSVGMPSLAMIFHPSHLPEFEMTCGGPTVWHERPVWRVLFQQRKDHEARMSQFRIGGKLVPVLLKGSAWIDKENYQILHLETDLLEAIPEVKLLAEHQALDYGPVQFENRKIMMWLPQQAEIYLDSGGRRFHHRHTYSQYRIFSVEVGQKIGSPKEIP